LDEEIKDIIRVILGFGIFIFIIDIFVSFNTAIYI